MAVYGLRVPVARVNSQDFPLVSLIEYSPWLVAWGVTSVTSPALVKQVLAAETVPIKAIARMANLLAYRSMLRRTGDVTYNHW